MAEAGSVLITGAARGIGLCTAREFARAGWTLVLTDRDAEGLERAAQELRALAPAVHVHVVDVTDRAAVEAMANDVLARLGALDVLVNNAGVGHLGELATTGVDTWRKLFDVNFWGPLYHVYAFLPSMMARRRGQIVNVSSGQAFFRLPTWGAYATAKLALGAFSEMLHFEVKKHGIAVTTVYPYLVNTGFYDGMRADTLAGRLSLRLMPYYSDTPEKVARLVFRAVRKRKKVEMVNLLNDVGFYSRLIPPVSDAVARAAGWLLAGKPGGAPTGTH